MAETLYTALLRHSGARPDQTFLIDADDEAWTYADLDAVTTSYAQRLIELGAQHGDRLASLVDRSPYAIFLYLACVRAGVVYLPLNPSLRPAELAPILDDASPSLIICRPGAALDTLAAPLPRVLTLDIDGSGTFAPVHNGASGHWRDTSVADDELAALMFTSGTTGRPKGAMMAHRHLVAKALSLSKALEWNRDDVLLHTMPLFHSHGLFMTLHSVLAAGASMKLLPRFDADEIVQALPCATVFSGVPTMYQRLLRTPALSPKACRQMRLFISASAPLGLDTQQEFQQRTGHAIVECWGMTETMTNAASPLRHDRPPGAVGLPLPDVEIRVTDPRGSALPAGGVGNLEVRTTPVTFGGYWGRDDDTRAALRSDGFFITGDLGFVDEKGHVSIVGRAKDVIITGGYNVYPREIETALLQMAGIVDAAVFGLPHPDFGEGVAAAVQVEEDASLNSQQIIEFLKERLIGYKVPKAVFVSRDLPRTNTGKVRKGYLQEFYSKAFSNRASN